MHLLIVEDEEKIANFLRRGFIEEHFAVDVAKDGEQALYETDINDYDCIILDILLPKVDGVTVCRKIREKSTMTPILLLTVPGLSPLVHALFEPPLCDSSYTQIRLRQAMPKQQ